MLQNEFWEKYENHYIALDTYHLKIRTCTRFPNEWCCAVIPKLRNKTFTVVPDAFYFFFIKNRLIAVCAIDFFALTYIKALIIVALGVIKKTFLL